jgi:thiol-disulfide isomerase/thioredoxin
MELEHREFLKEHYNNYETALSGYVRNLDLPVLKMYEHIYRLYLNPTFILTIWCGDCRMQMLLRLYKYYESLPIENQISEKGEKSEVVENQQVIIKKTKNKKNG